MVCWWVMSRVSPISLGILVEWDGTSVVGPVCMLVKEYVHYLEVLIQLIECLSGMGIGRLPF